MGLRGIGICGCSVTFAVSIYPKAEMVLRVILYCFLYGRIIVSIYPKAEMGLRDIGVQIDSAAIRSFNLPEGRDGFKSSPEVGSLYFDAMFQSTRRQRWV